MTAQEIESRVVSAIPGAQVKAVDLKGGDHFEIEVVSERFRGCSMVQQHRMIYDALGDAMRVEIHALAIQTLTPEQRGVE